MIVNPELRRNIWLSFSTHRLLLTPSIVGLITYITYQFSHHGAASIAFYLACFFIFLWGTKNASEAVIEEVNNSTWDFQRQSTISPWSMALGKLLGATSFSWYAALISLALYLALSPTTYSFYSIVSNQLSPLRSAFIIVLGGLFAQALALLLSMQVLDQIRHRHTNKTFRYCLAGIVLGLFVTEVCFLHNRYSDTIGWHNIAFSQRPFAMISLIIFLSWAIIGLYRSFCKELQYQPIPWVWLLFNIFCVVYFSGFIPTHFFSFPTLTAQGIGDVEQAFSQAPFYIGFITAQILTYLALSTDMLSKLRYQKLLLRLKENHIKEMLQQFPWWPISMGLTIVVGILAIFFSHFSEQFLEIFSPTIFIVTSILFLLRDIALFHYFYFGPQPQKALSTIMLYLFVLYFLVPLLLGALSLNRWLPLFLPSAGQHTLLAFVSVAIQIIFLGLLIKNNGKPSKKLS